MSGIDRPSHDLETTDRVDFTQSLEALTSEVSRDTHGNSTTGSSIDKLAQGLKKTKLIDFDDENAQAPAPAPELPWDWDYAAVKTCNTCSQTGHADKDCRMEDIPSETLLEVAHQIICPGSSKEILVACVAG